MTSLVETKQQSTVRSQANVNPNKVRTILSKKRRIEEEITPQAENLPSKAYEADNQKERETVPQLIEEKRSGASCTIFDLKRFILDAVINEKAEKQDFLMKSFEKRFKKIRIVHPLLLLLQEGVPSKQVTLMQQCLANISNREVCTHLLSWVSRRRLIKYLLAPTAEGKDMLIIEIAAQDRVEILELMFDKIGDFNILEEEDRSLCEQATKRNLSQATIAILNKHLNWYIIPSNMESSKKIAVLLADQIESKKERQAVAQIIRRKGYQLKEIFKFSKSEFKDYLEEVKNRCSIILMVVMSHGSDGTISATDGCEIPIDEITNMICLEVPQWIPKVMLTQLSPITQRTDSMTAHSTATEQMSVKSTSDQEVLRRSKMNSIQLRITSKVPLSVGDSMLQSLMEEWRQYGEPKEFEDMIRTVGKAKSEQYSLQIHDKLINRLFL